MRQPPGKVEPETAHADRRYHAPLSAYSAPLAPHAIAQWHTTATFLRRASGRECFAAAFRYLMLRRKFKDLTRRGNEHGDKSFRLGGLTPGAG
jgi:hypothetical protein